MMGRLDITYLSNLVPLHIASLAISGYPWPNALELIS